MSLYRPFHFVFGEYVFQTDTKNFPGLANLLAAEKINFWGTKQREDKVNFRSSIFSAEEITNLSRKRNIPLTITRKNGIPFLFSRYRRRYGLILGLALGLFLLFFSQLFVWKIEISGNREMTVPEIELALSECGISVGSFIPAIDVGEKANELLINCRSLSSAAISINGTHLTVSVLERTVMPDIIDTAGFYNVVASRDGVILDIDAADGTPMVAHGETVAKGQLLINSFIEGENGTFRPTHARGIVYAAVYEEFKTEIPLERVKKQYTGAVETKRAISVLGWEAPFVSDLESDYEYFDALSAEKTIKLFGFIELPVKETKVIYSEYTPATEIIDSETAYLLAQSQLDDHLDDLDLEVLECVTEFYEDKEKGVWVLTANALLRQNIAKEVVLDMDQNISDKLPKPRE